MKQTLPTYCRLSSPKSTLKFFSVFLMSNNGFLPLPWVTFASDSSTNFLILVILRVGFFFATYDLTNSQISFIGFKSEFLTCNRKFRQFFPAFTKPYGKVFYFKLYSYNYFFFWHVHKQTLVPFSSCLILFCQSLLEFGFSYKRLPDISILWFVESDILHWQLQWLIYVTNLKLIISASLKTNAVHFLNYYSELSFFPTKYSPHPLTKLSAKLT